MLAPLRRSTRITPSSKRKMTVSELSKAWRDIYATFEENAFDYVGRPFYMQDETIKLWDGIRMVEYAEVPF